MVSQEIKSKIVSQNKKEQILEQVLALPFITMLWKLFEPLL